LAKRVTEISIQFKLPPMLLFKDAQGRGAEGPRPNILSMRIQPDEGITLQFGAKVPGPTMTISKVNMDFSYAQAFGKSSANGYERRLLDSSPRLRRRLRRIAASRGLQSLVGQRRSRCFGCWPILRSRFSNRSHGIASSCTGWMSAACRRTTPSRIIG